MQEKQLGQTRPADTNAASLYSPAASTTAIIYTIMVCNTSGSATTYRVFCDDDGTTYDETSALVWDAAISANTSQIIEIKVSMNDASGNLAVRSGAANALTFTAFGVEIT